MDSKLKRRSIFITVLLVLAIMSIVLVSNWSKLQRRFGNDELQTVSETMSVTVSETGENSTGNNSIGDASDSDATTTVRSAKYGDGFAGADSKLQVGEDLHAFLQDETFFNKETSRLDALQMESANSLSMVITSIEKDMRIQIVDPQGKLVTGQSFFVDLQDNGEYKDLDKDGIIYIGGLKPGNYNVTMKPVNGYMTPNDPMKVTVKDRVEYATITDISLLIKTEDEIDAEQEDTFVNDALEDADASEVTSMKNVSENGIIGIDVSKWNKQIDWEKVKASGVEFAIIRCGYRGASTGALVEDPMFEQNIQGAKAAGIKVGTYFFTQAVSAVEAVEEASMVITLCRDYNIEYPAFIDTEGAGGSGRADQLDSTTRTIVCQAFCETLQSAGFTAGVYASRNWLTKNLDVSQLERFCIWLAEYRKIPEYQGYYQMWQYTSGGSVDGIEGRVDLDIGYLE